MSAKQTYDGHNRKAGHAKAMRDLAHRRARRLLRGLLRLTIHERRMIA